MEEPFEEIEPSVIELMDVVETGKVPGKESPSGATGAGAGDRAVPEGDPEPGDLPGEPPFTAGSRESADESTRADSFTLPREDFSGLLDESEDEFKFTEELEEAGHAGSGESFSVSERRLEAIVARVVEDVVERVTRETVARVTEKVLTAAIESIKENLEDPSK